MIRSVLVLALATLFVSTTASAALYVNITSSHPNPMALNFGEAITVDVTLTTDAPGEAVALGLRAIWNQTQPYSATADFVPSIFNFSPSLPFGGLTNTLAAPVEDGVGPGYSLNLFQGVSLAPAAGSGPDTFSITFVPHFDSTELRVGAFSEYLDTYIGGDNGMNEGVFNYFVIPEPGTALLLGLGLFGLAGSRRR